MSLISFTRPDIRTSLFPLNVDVISHDQGPLTIKWCLLPSRMPQELPAPTDAVTK